MLEHGTLPGLAFRDRQGHAAVAPLLKRGGGCPEPESKRGTSERKGGDPQQHSRTGRGPEKNERPERENPPPRSNPEPTPPTTLASNNVRRRKGGKETGAEGNGDEGTTGAGNKNRRERENPRTTCGCRTFCPDGPTMPHLWYTGRRPDERTVLSVSCPDGACRRCLQNICIYKPDAEREEGATATKPEHDLVVRKKSSRRSGGRRTGPHSWRFLQGSQRCRE